MRFLSSVLLTSMFAATAGAQTAEGTAAAAAGAAFSVIEESLISEFFKSTGLTPQELEVLGEVATIITGEEAISEAVSAAVGEDEDEKGKGKGQGKNKNNTGGGLPPGHAKRDSLPPGLAKYLEKHGTLPPGLEVRGLPAALTAQLPDLGPGRKRVVVDDDIVLIETATGKVLDIIVDVITGP